jgi:Na+/phosphate symporter
MLIAVIPLMFVIVGLLMWALCSNAKLQEAGRIMFFCGLLVLTFSLAGKTVTLG